MNAKQAKEISILQYLAQQGHKPIRFLRGEHISPSPFRKETDASFFVKENAGNDGEDIWNDFGLSAMKNGGDIIEFVKVYLNTDTRGALQHLDNYSGFRIPRSRPVQNNSLFDGGSNDISIVGTPSPLHHFVLLKYLREVRYIPDVLSQRYLKVIWYTHRKTGDKKFFSFGWQNQSGAYELRAANSDFKSVTGKKDITYIRPQNTDEKMVYIFEGMLDFLSALVIKGQTSLAAHIIILNSTTQIKKCMTCIDRIQPSHIRTFFDNDKAGNDAAATLQKLIADKYPIERMAFYDEYKDVNDYLVAMS